MHSLVSTLKFTVAINTKKLLCHAIENQFIDDFSDNFERNRYCKTFQSTGETFFLLTGSGYSSVLYRLL